jgi:hypothetical protein
MLALPILFCRSQVCTRSGEQNLSWQASLGPTFDCVLHEIQLQ